MPFTLTPWRKRALAPAKANGDIFASMQREMNRVLERFSEDFDVAPFDGGTIGEWSPTVNVAETEKEISVSAELPGVAEKDVEVTIEKDTLTIKGEKKEEKEEKGKNYYRTERSFGSFQRTIPLPCEIEKDQSEATYKSGVLTVKLPKTKAAQQSTKKIPIKHV